MPNRDQHKILVADLANPESIKTAILQTGLKDRPLEGEIASVVALLLGRGQRSITGQAIDVNNGAWMA